MANNISKIHGLETVESLKNWCLIDASYGKVSLKDQIKSTIEVYKKSNPTAVKVLRLALKNK